MFYLEGCKFSLFPLQFLFLFENFNIFTNSLISLKAAKLLQCVFNGTGRTKIKGKFTLSTLQVNFETY
jgi:hypothetical protein